MTADSSSLYAYWGVMGVRFSFIPAARPEAGLSLFDQTKHINRQNSRISLTKKKKTAER